jgi:hypothetical protein
MHHFSLTTPVALLIFNRPAQTRRVFAEIRQARPTKLLVVADGPRSDRPGEDAKCAESRAVISDVNWPCEVLTNYSDVNLGCKRRVSSGLDWVFDQVEQAIILEDDCLPHPSFFRYCQELLVKYADDQRIFHISGDHFRVKGPINPYSYYFSRFNFIWGWATWRRAWRYYDVEMKLWPTVRDGNWLADFLKDASEAARFTRSFESIYNGEIDTWDYQWGLACWIHHGLSIRPNVNLVSNIGFHAEATHTKAETGAANLPTEVMLFPLRHPPFMLEDTYEDRYVPEDLQGGILGHRTLMKITRFFKKMFVSKKDGKKLHNV